MNLRSQLITAALAAAVLFGLTAGGCDVSDDQRCDDLDSILEARALQLPRACEERSDCVLVEVRPGYIVSSNSTPQDPELDDVRRRRVELCGPWADDGVVYQAQCVDDVCMANKLGVVDRPDAGDNNDVPDVGADTGDCACSTDDDCNFGEACTDGCTCNPVCRDACLNLERCDQLNAQTGLGSNLDNCIELCIDRTGGVGDIPACLRDSACDQTLNCL